MQVLIYAVLVHIRDLFNYRPQTNPVERGQHIIQPLQSLLISIANLLTLAKIKYCNAKNISFLAQNGGSGWSSSLNLGPNGVIINMRALNQVSFNSARDQATIGGGTLISEAIDAAYDNNAQLTTGNCDCVGVLGAVLGGGYGNLMGLNGFGVDTVLSLNYVSPYGKLTTVTPKDKELWWALRGAGPNFGVVTSAVVKSNPVPQANNTAWLGQLIYSGDQLERVVSAISNLTLEPEMNVFLYFAISESKPVVLITPFYYGEEATARRKFASLLDIGPLMDTTAIVPQNHWNDGAARFCIRGGRKPAYAAGMLHMLPAVWRAVWIEFVKFTSNPGTDQSIVLMEAYSLGKGRSVPDSASAFPFRQVTFNAVAIPWYYNASLDPVAEAYGNRVRDIWWTNDNMTANTSYINFAHGDENLDVVYGQHTQKLQALKAKYDPKNLFNHWFPLNPRPQTANLRLALE
ncbi:MAG: hypothetical protein L6R42_000911 [Xanthoria sp. 1 TBL-2021]|nr:MAG: hypothetical protein L6R42_000911 [Xanthoria sp. 1 TBL-2021]